MQRKIILATNNVNKMDELRPILLKMMKNLFDLEGELLTLKDLDVDIDVEEFENSLYENSFKKAKETYQYLLEKKLINIDDIVISEDSGLFGQTSGYPGVITKREMKKLGVEEMLNLLREKEDGDLAYYKSVITLYTKDKKFFCVSKESGYINDKPKGNYNYPIDRYFCSDTRGYLGEITPEKFSKTSFRRYPYKIEEIDSLK